MMICKSALAALAVALTLGAATASAPAFLGAGGALRLRGGYGDDGGYGGGGYGGDDVGYGSRGRGGGFRGRGFRGRGRGRGRGTGGYTGSPTDGIVDELKTYVGGLSWNIDDQGLLDAFSPYGQCEAKVMVDKYTGRSRGFGFVTFQTPEECAAAIEGMNGKELDGRAITCNNARQKTYDTEGGGGDGAAGGDGGGHMGGGEHMGHEQGDMQ